MNQPKQPTNTGALSDISDGIFFLGLYRRLQQYLHSVLQNTF